MTDKIGEYERGHAAGREAGIREAAALVGVKVGRAGDVQGCACGQCAARREDHSAILALLDSPPAEEGYAVSEDLMRHMQEVYGGPRMTHDGQTRADPVSWPQSTRRAST